MELTRNILKNYVNIGLSDFDWKKHENLINSFTNFKTNVDGIDIHFIQEKGSGKNPNHYC